MNLLTRGDNDILLGRSALENIAAARVVTIDSDPIRLLALAALPAAGGPYLREEMCSRNSSRSSYALGCVSVVRLAIYRTRPTRAVSVGLAGLARRLFQLMGTKPTVQHFKLGGDQRG